ncbi:6-phosphogluconolactonase [Shimia litoralis]|uniref:6-phosphogluconolactonase n=1 Tax=Shimia litoralis TaxID=420403 RepID=A0A4U7N6H4_9RHOB|nr:6-phosphogluconolactonase [Shimia litoralis]TKZ21203.1 6-phosphogluconolactonase [Shimia litoralis]
MKFVEYADSEMMAIDLANIVAAELTEALHQNDRVCLAVAGGTTPGPIFDALCAADLDWTRVDVMPTDERWVPEDHARSNAGLIKQRLLVDRASAARFLPLFMPATRPEDVLPELESMIAPALPIDVALIGMGEDMHTASLFPDSDGLAAALDPHAPILVPIRRPDLPESRVTLSARVLRAATCKHVVFRGAAKKEALTQSRHLPDIEAPIQSVLSDATIHWAV